jgi:hypothetical protein
MDTITNNKYVKFVIENYEDIKAMQEIYEYAQENLPKLVNDEIVDTIIELEESYFKETGLEVERDVGGVWWSAPERYDTSEEKGVFFGFESNIITGITWSNLCKGVPDDTAYLFVYVHTGNIKGMTNKQEYIDQWRELLKAKRRELRKKGILPWFDDDEFDYTDPYILYYPLYKEVNMNTIANRENFRRGVQDAVKLFISTVLPILREATR